MKRKSILSIAILMLTVIISLSGCAQLNDFLGTTKGLLVGQEFQINIYDHYANKTMELEGSKVTIGLLEDSDDSSSFPSSVIEITINGNQMLQVGNTVIFAEKSLDMIEDYEVAENIDITEGGGFVPFDRTVNNLKNKIGKSKTIIISSQMGIPIGVYQGEEVYVTVPNDLPKMTRLNIDGKSLYIHRANYVIMDTAMIK
ncbi:MAG TPA: DUF5052 family protein [Clostridiales bacterium]|nr:DUF5052 family protein [Clostridiales bacterium]